MSTASVGHTQGEKASGELNYLAHWREHGALVQGPRPLPGAMPPSPRGGGAGGAAAGGGAGGWGCLAATRVGRAPPGCWRTCLSGMLARAWARGRRALEGVRGDGVGLGRRAAVPWETIQEASDHAPMRESPA